MMERVKMAVGVSLLSDKKIVIEKAKSLLHTLAKIENRLFPSKCKATTGGLEEVSNSNVKISLSFL